MDSEIQVERITILPSEGYCYISEDEYGNTLLIPVTFRFNVFPSNANVTIEWSFGGDSGYYEDDSTNIEGFSSCYVWSSGLRCNVITGSPNLTGQELKIYVTDRQIATHYYDANILITARVREFPNIEATCILHSHAASMGGGKCLTFNYIATEVLPYAA